ncbi:N-acetylmuramoyl-L-alanine amidase [Aquibacillus halophilus]|uniref:N-acetylmuramoyl-L-alanine amidase n=1 Tax=Aquibacillus halophilus TaxID=930132 RepID=A0A6A8DDE5_9BACI|nr:N-acetylmuramoyl-L-alanine amidase [Aquibacillus halophilus]
MKPILIIDPGHGGKDPGGGSNRYWIEKDMNLQISLYQYNRFKKLNIPVSITRQEDLTLTNDKRTKIVRKSGATYCISNHINAGGGDGAEIIYSIYSDGKMAKNIAYRLEKKGQNVRRVFTRTLPTNSRKDYYFMIRETGNVITNIIEYGFADSLRDDVEQVRENWNNYAEAVVQGFCEFSGFRYLAPRKIDYVVNKYKRDEPESDNKTWFIGKRVESRVDGLRFYNRPSWKDDALVNVVNKGIGFPKILAKIEVDDGYQFKVENSSGIIFYITANEKYIRVI